MLKKVDTLKKYDASSFTGKRLRQGQIIIESVPVISPFPSLAKTLRWLMVAAMQTHPFGALDKIQTIDNDHHRHTGENIQFSQ
mmetsp:Transcript_26126/g.56099  ORF Transcript_26126/g.56099 Transcript_26126/m.56099 type:complete len:83 (-) Transcript_26126:2423-2671(-)